MTAPCPAIGFHVTVEMVKPLSQVARSGFRETWTQMLAGRGLDGRMDDAGNMYGVVFSEAAQVTEADRTAIGEWLATRLEVSRFDLGPLVDLRDER